nr:BPK_HP1_G0058330.mRNA.1.CDS.1 [Saccharomyces cerevisiae]
MINLRNYAPQTHPFILIGDELGNIHICINSFLWARHLFYFDVRDKDAKLNVAGNEDGKILISDDQEDEVLVVVSVDSEVADNIPLWDGRGYCYRLETE